MTATWTSPNKSFNEQKQQQSMCVINICTFLSRPLQNKNEKWPSSAQSKEHEQPQLNFGISIWYWTLSLHVKSQHVFREFGKFIFDCVSSSVLAVVTALAPYYSSLCSTESQNILLVDSLERRNKQFAGWSNQVNQIIPYLHPRTICLSSPSAASVCNDASTDLHAALPRN